MIQGEGMKKHFTRIAATTESDSQLMFTPAAVLDLLSQIDELSDAEVGLTETLDNKIQIVVGDSIYEIEGSVADSIDVAPEVIDTIDEVNLEAYQDLMDSDSVEYIEDEPVTGGIIKDTIKSLLLGGMIRFAGKHLLN